MKKIILTTAAIATLAPGVAIAGDYLYEFEGRPNSTVHFTEAAPSHHVAPMASSCGVPPCGIAHAPAPTHVPAPSYDAPNFDAPTFDAPSYDAPTYTAPTYKPPTYSPPTFESPTFESPTFESPTFHGSSGGSVAAPNFDAPTFDAPTFDAPTYAAPVYKAPTYKAPTYNAPVFNAPVFIAPTFEEPKIIGPQGSNHVSAYVAPSIDSLYSGHTSYNHAPAPTYHAPAPAITHMPQPHYSGCGASSCSYGYAGSLQRYDAYGYPVN